MRYWLCGIDGYQNVLDVFSPDILHVYGTENEFSNKLIALFNKPDRTIVNIQGMACLYAEVYTDGLPPRMQIKQRLFEGLIKNGILNQRDSLRSRGKTEKDTLSRIYHVIGRTDIDRMFALSLNPNVHYHHCNEILRKNFYVAEHWDISRIKRHSIVLRSTGNPIKGLYQMLCAMPHIINQYPDAHLYVIGNSYKTPRNYKQRFAEGSYNKLLRETVECLRLSEYVSFLGTLDANQMEQLYLKTHVVVSASVIENESNVVSEAKLLGVPVVASYVGGLPNRIAHGKDGYLYPFNMPQMLAYYIKEIFSNDSCAQELSKNAIASQSKINDPVRNIMRLIDIYTKIIETVDK